MSAVLDIPVFETDDEMDSLERKGFDLFRAGNRLAEARSAAAARGWWMAWARCYAQGVKSATFWSARLAIAVYPRDIPDPVNPYPEFSGAAEAWGLGFDDADAIPYSL